MSSSWRYTIKSFTHSSTLVLADFLNSSWILKTSCGVAKAWAERSAEVEGLEERYVEHLSRKALRGRVATEVQVEINSSHTLFNSLSIS